MANILNKSDKNKQLIVDTSDIEILQVYNIINTLLKYN